MSFELNYVRIRWKQKPDFTGAAFPFGCVYERGISRPVIRGMVEGRVRALPAAYEILCSDCLTPEDPKLPQAQQKHAPGCLRAPKVVAPAPAPALERDTVPAGPAYPRDLAPADLLADIEREAGPAVIHPIQGRIEGEEAQAIREQVLAQPAPPLAAEAEPAPIPRPAQAVPVQRVQQKGRGR